MQLDHQATGTVGELRGLVKAFFRGAVEVFQIGQLVAGDRVFFQIGHQHAELGAPVAYVVLANHLVAEEFQYTGHAIANDGGAQVAHMHLFGQVGRGHVDHGTHGRGGLAYTDFLVSQGRVEARSQGLGVLEEIQEARAGDFGFADLLIGGQCRDDFFSQITGFHTRRLGQHHGDVAGEVAVGFVTGVFHLNRWRQAFRQHTFCDELS